MFGIKIGGSEYRNFEDMNNRATKTGKWRIVIWKIVSIFALLLSIIAICRSFYRTVELGFDYMGVIVGALAILVTSLVTWNIYSAIDANHKIKDMQMEIDNIRSSIDSDKITSERKINKLKAELYDNVVSINRHILGFEKSAVSTHLLIDMLSSIDYLSRSAEYDIADLRIDYYYVMTKDNLELIKKDLDKEDSNGLLRLLYEIPNKEKIKNFSKLEELITLACS